MLVYVSIFIFVKTGSAKDKQANEDSDSFSNKKKKINHTYDLFILIGYNKLWVDKYLKIQSCSTLST